MTHASNSDNIYDSEDAMKILIAIDIHLGYNFNKRAGESSDESFDTFEEILQYSKEENVDLILFGGDLFHDAKPTVSDVSKCMELLRKYCTGPRKINIEFLGEPELIFPHFENLNFNINVPIFSIYGESDYPSSGTNGQTDSSGAESVSSLINYFGKWTVTDKMIIRPLAIKKGNNHVAIYGLGYMDDDKLTQMLDDSKVDLLPPSRELASECFNLFVLHQKRVPYSKHGYISEAHFPPLIHLVVWGGEHECRITGESVSKQEYYVTQPGSTVATSLCEGESEAKHIGILCVNDYRVKLKKLKLKTVRPFVFDTLNLDDVNIKELRNN